jgi:hypothetical protein
MRFRREVGRGVSSASLLLAVVDGATDGQRGAMMGRSGHGMVLAVVGIGLVAAGGGTVGGADFLLESTN